MTELTLDDIKHEIDKRLKPLDLCTTFNSSPPTFDEITDERLCAAYESLAKLMTEHGEVYLPLFKRLYSEVDKRKKNDEYLALARTIGDPQSAP